MDELPYTRLPDAPTTITGRSVMVRLVDGLGFRYRWATEGLADIDPEFRPGDGSMSLTELLTHVAELADWLLLKLGGASSRSDSRGIEPLRRDTLDSLIATRKRLLELGDEELLAIRVKSRNGIGSFWNLINGPLADTLTHVGQINAWRRLAGHPTPPADVFLGQPPGGTPDESRRVDTP
jgi:uncharacterized damage-inducible protein DinB